MTRKCKYCYEVTWCGRNACFSEINLISVNKKQKDALALIVMTRLMRKRRKRQRRTWCSQWIANHDSHGAYCNLIRELQDSDSASSTNFMRMKDLFDDILTRIQPLIERCNTNMRTAGSDA